MLVQWLRDRLLHCGSQEHIFVCPTGYGPGCLCMCFLFVCKSTHDSGILPRVGSVNQQVGISKIPIFDTKIKQRQSSPRSVPRIPIISKWLTYSQHDYDMCIGTLRCEKYTSRWFLLHQFQYLLCFFFQKKRTKSKKNIVFVSFRHRECSSVKHTNITQRTINKQILKVGTLWES